MGGSLSSDVIIAGGGIIGLSLGLELRQRGFSVIVLERHRAMRAASWAAGGMLAARDPENPPALLPLSLHSLALYPNYMERIEAASGLPVRPRTSKTLQQNSQSAAWSVDEVISREAIFQEAQSLIPGLVDSGEKFIWLEEQSLDPRDFCRALPAAFLAENGTLLEENPVLAVENSGLGVLVQTPHAQIHADTFVNCCGAWAGVPPLGGLPVEPIKGQAITVALAPERLPCVLRTREFYAIPRGDGRVTIGATVENVGFDETVEPHRIAALLSAASRLLPEILDAEHLESWAGLRPSTPDGLPVLGPAELENCWHATGHYRNGVLLAPVTARLIAQMITGESLDIPIQNFSPSRFDFD